MFVADVGLAELWSAGKDICLVEVGEVIVSLGSVLGNGTDRTGTPSINFCLGGGSEGEAMGILVHSSGFVLGVGREAGMSSEDRALYGCGGRDVEEEATESAFEALLELRKRPRELGGDNDLSKVGGGGGFNHVRMVRRASSRLDRHEPHPDDHEDTYLTVRCDTKSTLLPTTKMTVSFGTVFPSSSSQPLTSSKLVRSATSYTSTHT